MKRGSLLKGNLNARSDWCEILLVPLLFSNGPRHQTILWPCSYGLISHRIQ